MAKHRADRPKGVVGETDPQKIKAEYDRIQRIAREADEASRQQRAQAWLITGGLTLAAAVAETAGRWPA